MEEQFLAVQRMQDYIAAHLQEEITMADLAGAALFSPWYSYRLFKKLTGRTPSDYIRSFRLAESAKKLKNETVKVCDMAFSMGFKSVDGYQRAFMREFGCNPKEYAAHPVPIPLFVPYGVKFRKLRKDNAKMETVKNVWIQTVTKPARKVIIKRGKTAEDYFTYCSEVGCDVWGLLLSMDSLCGEPVCLWLPERMQKPSTSVYVQGVEVDLDFNEAIPEGFDILPLPEAEYLMFQGEPFREEDYCQAITAVQHSMNRYDPSVIGYQWDDSQPRIQLEPRGDRGYIELRAVKALGNLREQNGIQG